MQLRNLPTESLSNMLTNVSIQLQRLSVTFSLTFFIAIPISQLVITNVFVNRLLAKCDRDTF